MPEPDSPDHEGPDPSPQRALSVHRLATYLPHTLIIDDLAITPEGTPVPDDQVDHVLAVAAANGVPVYEMET